MYSNITILVSGKALAAGKSLENVDPDSPVASAKPLKSSAVGRWPARSREAGGLVYVRWIT